MISRPPKISVIVATRDRLASLRACVASLRAQTYPRDRMELIVVDDGSGDGTAEYLADLAASEPWVVVATQPHGWQATARNRGIALSRGDLIAITDDDCTVAPDWLSSLAEAMGDDTIDAIGGHVGAPGDSLIATYLNYVRVLNPGLLPDGQPRYLVHNQETCSINIR